MASSSITAEPSLPSASAEEAGRERLQARLMLMGELEASLGLSQKALLELDLLKIESETQQQAGWMQKFHVLMQPTIQATMAAVPRERSAAPNALRGVLPLAEAEQEYKRSQARILDALRLQAALLTRARAKLRVLGNMLAGPTATYGLLPAGDQALTRWNSKPREEI
jgi:hypothetical protein